MSNQDSERRPLLNGNNHSQDPSQDQNNDSSKQTVEFSDNDPENPRSWSKRRKYAQVLQVFVIAFVCPMASSVANPAADDIASEFNTSKIALIGAQSAFVCMLGIGPLFHAPMSETFGRRRIYLLNLCLFTLLQIPTALAPNIATLIVVRALSGFVGSVGVANGGGTISDMFETHERAPVLGIYLIAPLLAPTIGPLLGGLIVNVLDWRYLFWFITIFSAIVTGSAFFFLQETRAVTLLQWRKDKLQRKHPDTTFVVEGVNSNSILAKIKQNSTRAIRILTTQPIVMTMSLYQALVFSSMYSLYAQWTAIWATPPYEFDMDHIGLLYLGPAVGFVLNSLVLVSFIDRVYTRLAKAYDNDGRPEYRLPLANIGAILLPISLFWFGWSVEYGLHWAVPLLASALFGASQVSIFNSVQTYYIDAFEQNAASALAAGAFLRSLSGGLVPLFVGGLFDSIGYGWGMSVFGFLSVVLMPAPLLFYRYGKTLREKFPFEG